MKNKPQKGNQLSGCHAGPFNRNAGPSSVHKLPHTERHVFFKQDHADVFKKKDDIGMNVETLIAALSAARNV
jgi:hypothetical protein